MYMKFLKVFSLATASSLIFAASNNAVADPAESRAGPFRLAKTDATFYLGYEKSVSLMRGAQAVPIQREARKTLDGTAAMTAARLSTLDAASSTPTFNFAHNIERFEIGNVKKTENLRTFSAVNTGVQAFADLTWGDTLWVVPTTAAGASVQALNVVIDRSVTGAGEASAMAHYDVLSKTYVNGLELPLLTYAIVKAPGGLDQILGQAVMRSEVAVQVGRRFTMEAVLTIVDGLAPSRVSASSEYLRDAFDGAGYTISIQPGLGLCLRSASGKFKSGDCQQ
jgi:hypothetical protein